MSTPQSKESLVRLSWLTELRRQGHRQCAGTYRKGEKVCALGLLAETMGADLAWHQPDGWVEAATGLHNWQALQVVALNDDHYTFAEIADVVAGWFPNK